MVAQPDAAVRGRRNAVCRHVPVVIESDMHRLARCLLLVTLVVLSAVPGWGAPPPAWQSLLDGYATKAEAQAAAAAVSANWWSPQTELNILELFEAWKTRYGRSYAPAEVGMPA